MAREMKIKPSEDEVLAVLENEFRTMGAIDYWIGARFKRNVSYAPGDTYCNQPHLKALLEAMVDRGDLDALTGKEVIALGQTYDIRPKSTYYATPACVAALVQEKKDRAHANLVAEATKRAVRVLTAWHPEDFEYLVQTCMADPEYGTGSIPEKTR